MTPVYVVSAYRWGLRDCHSYVVGVKLDKTEAIALANASESRYPNCQQPKE